MDTVPLSSRKPYRVTGMEGMLARWYARNTAKLGSEFRACAASIAGRLPAGAQVLEVAPGPGYLAIELARLGSFHVTGLDISRSFVRLAAAHAARAGVAIAFRLGDAASMPFGDDSFDFIVCRAAFKNFSRPVDALKEMHRVLRPRCEAEIIDMRRDASDQAINEAVAGMHLGRFDAFVTRATFKHVLRKRAYSRDDFQRMAAATAFGRAEIEESPLGFDVWLRK